MMSVFSLHRIWGPRMRACATSAGSPLPSSSTEKVLYVPVVITNCFWRDTWRVCKSPSSSNSHALLLAHWCFLPELIIPLIAAKWWLSNYIFFTTVLSWLFIIRKRFFFSLYLFIYILMVNYFIQWDIIDLLSLLILTLRLPSRWSAVTHSSSVYVLFTCSFHSLGEFFPSAAKIDSRLILFFSWPGLMSAISPQSLCSFSGDSLFKKQELCGRYNHVYSRNAAPRPSKLENVCL